MLCLQHVFKASSNILFMLTYRAQLWRALDYTSWEVHDKDTIRIENEDVYESSSIIGCREITACPFIPVSFSFFLTGLTYEK